MAYSGQILHRQCDQQEPSVLSKALTVIDCIELFNSINACPTDESIDRLGWLFETWNFIIHPNLYSLP